MADSKDPKKPKASKSQREMHCAFCGKPESAAKKMVVVGKNQKPICEECIHICTQILDDTGINER